MAPLSTPLLVLRNLHAAQTVHTAPTPMLELPTHARLYLHSHDKGDLSRVDDSTYALDDHLVLPPALLLLDPHRIVQVAVHNLHAALGKGFEKGGERAVREPSSHVTQ